MKLPQNGPDGPFLDWTNFSITLDKPGMFETLGVKPASRRPPGFGEVEIEVHSVALNFKEVLQALGIIPAPSTGITFGLECAGVVLDVGPDVVGLTPGMEVIATEGPCLSAMVTVQASSVFPKPAHLSWEQAASLGIAYLTAYYGLHRLGRLQAGESVLIHAATGGVGLAAIQVAQWIGAEIFATAGSARKRAFLTQLGIKHVYDSRSVAFAEQIMEETGGSCVDVVLNSLAGEFIPKSLSVLAPFGRFLEIGRRDVLANTPIPLSLLEKGAALFVVNLYPGTPGYQDMFSEILQLLGEGVFRPLPCQAYSLRRLDEAMDLLARAKHIGKVVINLPKRNASASVEMQLPLSMMHGDTDATARRPVLSEGLLSSEGLDVFRRVLAGHAAQVVVSMRSLDSRMQSSGDPELHEPDGMPEQSTTEGQARPATGTAYVPPRSDLEGTICGIWEKFFRIKLIGIHDNFFDIGGDSLLAVQLTARLRDAVGVDLSPHSLLESPTISGLAEIITRAKASKSEIKAPQNVLPRCLVRIKEGDPQQPLFLVHPAGGHVYNYLALALATSAPQEIYGVEAEPLDQQIEPLDTIEKMGKHYTAQIRKRQPRGPYLLGGASFGGALAYEIAQNLLRIGEQIDGLFLIDTADPAKLPKHELEDSEVLAYLLKVAVNIPDGLDDLKQLLPDEQIRYFIERAKKVNKLFPTVSLAEAQQILKLSRINLNALAHYRPKPIACKITLFLALEQGEGVLETGDLPWMQLAQPGSAVHHIPGNHITMNFMPHVQVMGDKITQILSTLGPNAPKPR